MTVSMLFGKLPAHGDFVARGMNDAERAWWDEQLSLAIAQAMEAHGVTFATRYDSAAPWCFHIRQGATMVTGAMVPSADRVGRRFPLVLARRDRPGVRMDAAACAATLLTARKAGWNADALVERCADMEEQEAATLPRGWWSSDRPVPAEAEIVADTPVPAMTAMLAETPV